MQAGILSKVRLIALSAACLPWVACASSGGDGRNNGTTGGSSSGGVATTSGGTTGGVTSGGAPATSGGSSSGGQTASGGVTVASGGQATTSGGSLGTAGSNATPKGGSSAGGAATSGGSSGSAGASVGGSSTGTAGSAGTANSSDPAPSAGCGKAATLMNGRASISVGGKMREYILALPSAYDQNHPYRLVFGWHPLGGSAQQVASGGYYGLLKESNGSAIFVSPEGQPFSGDSLGWGNKNGEDIAFLDAMLDLFRKELCIDENRIFSTGFSFGGMFSFAAGCSPTGMMRAVAPMAGNSMVSGCEKGTRPVALMGFHGTEDQVVAIDGGRKGRDIFVERNKCMQTTTTVESSWCDGLSQNYQPCTCTTYDGCMAGYPVTWCEYKGSHMPAPSSAATIWKFFAQF